MEIRLKPDFAIQADQTISAILYTIRWSDPGIQLVPEYIYPYFVIADGDTVHHNDYIYQVFAALPMFPVGNIIPPGDELIISTFTHDGGDCFYFELIEDSWTQANNGNYYCELQGLNITGILYNSLVHNGPVGGYVEGGGDIYFGQNTGPLTLEAYDGNIAHWQKQHNNSPWVVIPNTAGLTSYSETPASAGVWNYRAEVTQGSCPPIWSDKARVNVSAATAWFDPVNNNWYEPANWTSYVPHPALDAEILQNDASLYPIIHADAQCMDLKIYPGAQLQLGSSGSLTVHGMLANEAGFSGLQLLSDGSDIASLIHFSEAVDATVELQLPGWSDWPENQQTYRARNLLSTVVHDQYIQPGFVPDPPTFNEEFLKYDEPQHQWINCASGTVPPLQWNPEFEAQFAMGKAYMAAYHQQKTLNFEGQLQANDLHISNLTHTTGNQNNYAGWHLLGNPFSAAINWQTGSWNRTAIGPYALKWNQSGGSFQVMLDDTSIPVAGGFMVYCLEQGNGSLTIPADARTHNQTNQVKNMDYNRIVLSVSDVDKITSQELIIKQDDEATNNFDPEKDVIFFPGFAPSFYAISDDNSSLMLKCLPLTPLAPGISLGFEKNDFDHFVIELNQSIDELPILVLVDLKTSNTQDLKQNPVYNFSAENDDDPNRFMLLFETVGIYQHKKTEIQVHAANNMLYINNTSFSDALLSVFDMAGRVMKKLRVEAQSSNQFSIGLPVGIYIVRINSHYFTGTYKIRII